MKVELARHEPGGGTGARERARTRPFQSALRGLDDCLV